jgi:hypothetical protein
VVFTAHEGSKRDPNVDEVARFAAQFGQFTSLP